MRRVLIVAALMTALASFTLPAAASDGRGLPRRYSADAFFDTTQGCVRTFVGVYPVAFKDRKTGQIVGASMNMQLEQYDVCNGNAPLLLASPGIVWFAPGEFQMSPGLNKAEMHTAVTVHDSVSGQDFRVTIDLDYARVGPRSTCSVQLAGGEKTTFCSASVEGDVSDGALNFTPEPGAAVFQEHRPW